MTGLELLAQHSLRAESKKVKRSCLVCRRYQLTWDAGGIWCEVPYRQASVLMAEYSTEDWRRSADRAKECGDFEDMRP